MNSVHVWVLSSLIQLFVAETQSCEPHCRESLACKIIDGVGQLTVTIPSLHVARNSCHCVMTGCIKVTFPRPQRAWVYNNVEGSVINDSSQITTWIGYRIEWLSSITLPTITSGALVTIFSGSIFTAALSKLMHSNQWHCPRRIDHIWISLNLLNLCCDT